MFIGIAVMVLLFGSFFIALHNIRHKQTAYNLLQQQKEETERQRAMLEEALANLKTTQEQLVHREKMASLGELTAAIAHEIQNPLNFVKNFSEVSTELADELQQEAAAGKTEEVVAMATAIKENLRMIAHHSNRADSIIKNMMMHSRANPGQKQPTDLRVLIDEYLRLSYHGLKAKEKSFQATLRTDFDERMEAVRVVPEEIGRVLLNLFNNAFYAVKEKQKTAGPGFEPLVEVSTRQLPGNIEICIRDNGTGIPRSIRNKILQPFYTTKPAGAGTGLGLSLSYDIIKAHRGELQVETKEGEYAAFKIILPL